MCVVWLVKCWQGSRPVSYDTGFVNPTARIWLPVKAEWGTWVVSTSQLFCRLISACLTFMYTSFTKIIVRLLTRPSSCWHKHTQITCSDSRINNLNFFFFFFFGGGKRLGEREGGKWLWDCVCVCNNKHSWLKAALNILSPTWWRCLQSLWFLVLKQWAICAEVFTKRFAVYWYSASLLVFLFLQLWSDGSHSIHKSYNLAINSVFLSSVVAVSASIVCRSRRLTVSKGRQPSHVQ